MRMNERHDLAVMKFKCLRMDIRRKDEVRCGVAVGEKMSDRVEQKGLVWFGHVKQMNGERSTK